jgi:hypothetical protein
VNHLFRLCHFFLDFLQCHLFLLSLNYLQCLDFLECHLFLLFLNFLECHLFLLFLEVLEEGMQVDDPHIDTTDSV